MRSTTIAGLLLGVIGIGVLWIAGVPFPLYPPPGMVILGAGAVVVAAVRHRWAPAVGAFLGLFVIAGFLLSPTGIGNLLGAAGPAVSAGSVVQLTGVVTAAVCGALAVRGRTGRSRAERTGGASG